MQSSAENDDFVMQLAAEALQMPSAERERFLSFKCKDRTDLYSQVAEVVEWEERMGNFLRQPLIQAIDLEDHNPEQKPFQPGQELCDGRFVVLREIGEGGMGLVYEAFDRKRDQRIAIKCAKPGFGSLLSPELEGALKVRHPNICLVNDTHTAKVDGAAVDFLTMEFLDGETLSTRLARLGRLPAEEGLDIARQLCAGLAAAHQSGILHRDLKTANIILARDKENKTRAVITDFGLATESRVQSELDGGTPRYMAPELWRGQKPSDASDVYALGVILYEMVTGQAPFRNYGGAGFEPSFTPTASPSSINNDLDSRWDRAVLPCLEAAPELRPPARELLAVFDRRPVWKSPVLAVTVLALVALGAGLQQPLRKLFKPADIRLTILPAEVDSDLRPMSDGVLQDIAGRLEHSQRGLATISVIPESAISSSNVKAIDDADAVFHATHALQLRIHRAGSQIVATESVIELAHRTHLSDFEARYSQETMGDMPAALAAAASDALHLRATSAVDVISPKATGSYDQGLYFLRRDDNSFDDAISHFRVAAQLDPHSPLPPAGLVEALVLKFRATNDPQWIQQADEALHAAKALEPDSVAVHFAAGRLAASKGHYEDALRQFQRVQELQPRNVDVLLRMAAVFDRQDRGDDAIRCYRDAISLDPGYYRAYEEFGVFYFFRGAYSSAAEQFRNAITRAPGVYDAYTYLGAAYSALGQDEEAEKVLLASLKIKESAKALNSLGVINAGRGQDHEAVEFYTRSLAIDRKSYVCQMNLADSLRRLHRLADAEPAYRAGMHLAGQELEQNPRSGYTRAYVAYFAARLGDRRRAEEEIGQALQLSPNDNTVIRRAVLTFEALGNRARALEVAAKASPQLLQDLSRHPDLTALNATPGFRELMAANSRR